MKKQFNLLLVAIVILLGAIAWILIRGQKAAVINSAADTNSTAPVIRVQLQSPVPASALQAQATSASAVEISRANTAQAPSNAKPAEPAKSSYTAAHGDTLSQVAAGLYGKDTKENRDAAIAANPSLAADPDRVLEGKTYDAFAPATSAAPSAPQAVSVESRPEPAAVAAPQPLPAASKAEPADVAATANDPSPAARATGDRVLKYTAQPGDSVSALAAGLLGSDSKTNRDAIINENKSLQNDPDRVVAGKSYKIPVKEGLSAATVTPPATSATTQPDADQLVKAGAARELRYTARPGDTVSKLAEALLGSDTQANRDAIVSNNASLKADPDHVVAGQTYWIPAPAAAEKP